MIFAVVCCRWGFVGGAVVLALGVGFALCGIALAGEAGDPFARLVSVALAAMFAAQLTINTGMTLGIMPVTGVTLPFVSYGGSSLVALWMQTGLLVNLAVRRLRAGDGVLR
jgi:rod shape determining protein RodA